MDLTEKNGQPSMEEILASIRRIIAEEPADAIFLAPKPATADVSRTSPDDTGEFKLPSMFRPNSPVISENVTVAPVRLTDALRGAISSPEQETRVVTPAVQTAGPAYSNGATNGSSNGDQGHAVYPSLSSLKQAARPEPEPQAFVPEVTIAVPAAVSGQPAQGQNEPQVARKMASFSDQRFMSMNSSPAPAVIPPQPQPTEMVQLGPAAAALVEAPVASAGVGNLNGSSVGDVRAPLIAALSGSNQQNAVAAVKAATGVDDQTAELLRPMLRQWLTENMPRMVEKALIMEVSSSVSPPKKD